MKQETPLAARLRPQSLEEFVGQEHIVGRDKLLYRLIKADKLRSIILYGPPGTGKTTLARIVANTTKSCFRQLNATMAGVRDIKEIIEEAKTEFDLLRRQTILFIDEIHRFNKSQQDTLLPEVESGRLILIGATTENPYFEVNKALVSRSVILTLNELSKEDIKKLLKRAIEDEKGFGNLNIEITDEAYEFLADTSNGDARNALNGLELAVLSTEPINDIIRIDLNVASECIQKRAIKYDKTEDNHYDTISAFIKSMRGSDPDAAVYYLARMLYAGEDPMFIARRIMICASEDVGNADPHALMVAVSAAQATSMVGLPECKIILSQAVAYIACAPKSNASCNAVFSAWDDVSRIQISGVPIYLRDAHYRDAKTLGVTGYKYPHDYPCAYVKQQYLPDELKDKIYYKPSENGVEKKIKENLDRLRGCQ